MYLSEKQIRAYCESDARINIFEGAVRSGKSFIALLRFLKELKYGPEGEYIIVGKTERTVIHNVIEPLRKLTKDAVRYNRGLGEFSIFHRKVYVVGAVDERSEGKIRGSTFAGALVDELTIIPEGFFRMLLSRLSVANAKLFGTTNPDSPYHWLKTDFLDRSDELNLKIFNFTLDDNPSLTKEYVSSLKREYKGLWYKRFIEGNWVLAEGSIFDFFDQKIHTVRAPASYAKYYLLGVDYGTTNAFAATLVGFNDDVKPALWIEKEYYWDSRKTGMQKTDLEYANDLKREFGGYPIRFVYLDPAAASFEVELRRAKWPVKHAKNDVLDGIRTMSNFFIDGNLVICRHCTNLIREIEGYVWDDKSVKLGEDRPVKLRDHAIDACRYAVHTHYGSKSSLKEITQEEARTAATQRAWNSNPMAANGLSPGSFGWQKY